MKPPILIIIMSTIISGTMIMLKSSHWVMFKATELALK